MSVVIPSYNYGRYLPRAVQSVLAQTRTAFELLIIDDGSTDETATIGREFARRDARVRYIHKHNAGLSAARNTGIREARGQYVAFLDADDEWRSEYLEKCLTALQSLPPDFGMIACKSIPIDPDSRLLPFKHCDRGGSREITRRDLVLKNRFAPTVIVRRAVFERCGEFDVTLRSSEDRDMWIRMASHFRIFYLDEPLVLKRTHSANMSRHSDRMRENMRRVLHRAFQEERGGCQSRLFQLKVNAYFHFQNAWMRHEEGRRRDAIRDMLTSLLLWPWFHAPVTLNEPVLFRVRGLARFALTKSNGADENGR